MDLNVFADEFAELVAQKVIQKLRTEQVRGGWPEVETKDLRPELPVDNDEAVAADPETPEDIPTPAPKLANTNEDKRRSVLSGTNIRTLRNKIAAAEKKSAEDYSHLSKDKLVAYIVDFENLIGHTLEEEIDKQLIAAGLKVERSDDVEDDNDLSESEPEDDTDPGELTRDQAERLDLPAVKKLAVAQGASESDLEGLDVMAVVNLLFGKIEVPEDDTEPEDDTDDELPGPDEINKMSIGELKSLIETLNTDYGTEIKYDRMATRGELIDAIFDSVEFVEED